MKIIVIIVTYNGMKWYQRCFDSLRNSAVPLHTIVIDNKSSDETVEFIKENYPEIQLIESDANLGFGKANNIGLKIAIEENADYVFLLNQDAWIRPNTIELLVGQMEMHPEYGILSPIHLNGSEKELDFSFPYYILADRCPGLISDFVVHGEAEDKIYSINFINAALWLISKKCLHDVGGFEPLFPHYGEDENYLSRIGYHNYKTGIYPKALGIHDRKFAERQNPSFSQILNKRYVYLLVILTNLHESLFRSIYRIWFDSTIAVITAFFKFGFKNMIVITIAFMKALITLPKISKNRKIAIKKQASFL